MIGRQRDLIRVVECAYQIELDRSEWLQRLADIFSTMYRGEEGVMVYAYDASRPEDGVKITDYALCNLDERFAQGAIVHNANSPAEDTRRVYHHGVRCSTVSEILAVHNILPKDHASFRLYREFVPESDDAWGLSASNPDGRGIGIAVPLREIARTPDEVRELWGLVGVHLATAYRLRRARNSGEPAEESAILEPGGSLVHADNSSFDADSREALSDAVRAVDEARSRKLRDKPEEALPMWQGLVDGRWSLVDRYESDGRRYVVAHQNDLKFDEPKALTQSERQVLAYAAQGDSDARISYSLGLDEDQIEALLVSAMEKLGVWTRAELMRLRRPLDD